MKDSQHRSDVRRVVFTGGPAAGKTMVLDLLQRHLGDEVVVLPEAATVLFKGGFPRRDHTPCRRVTQRAIFDLQRSVEALHACGRKHRPLICDRGSLDGGAYWPDGFADFLRAMRTTKAAEYARYAAVVHMETAAYDPRAWKDENPIRKEDAAEARRIDRRLKRIWGGHPHFVVVPHATHFYEKVATCLFALHRILGVGAAAPAPAEAAAGALRGRARRTEGRGPRRARTSSAR